MPGKARLSGGLARVFPDHRARIARAYRAEFDVLRVTFNLTDPLLLREVARVAMLAVRAREANRAWGDLVAERRTGRGRRPSPRQIERARRAAALDDLQYATAADRLRELAGPRKPATLT